MDQFAGLHRDPDPIWSAGVLFGGRPQLRAVITSDEGDSWVALEGARFVAIVCEHDGWVHVAGAAAIALA